eukprot:2874431-Prorocentrum_lima.AAC.1
MTSSLVGSEMCIRDRAVTGSGKRRWGCGDEFWPGGRPPSLDERGAGSVSYTHLTLPTICSV